MKTFTEDIAAIKAAHAALGERIAKLEASTAEPAFFEYQGKRIQLATGEIYVGTIITRHDGYHLILLPGQVESENWARAMMWAKSVGGELPNRIESAILFATLKDQFEDTWYWASEELVSGSVFAWGQSFEVGYQCYNHKSLNRRARAIRRLDIEG
jgi:hypothetical protein